MMQNSTKVREELNKLNANGKNASKGLDQVEQSADRASQSMFKLSTIAKAVSAALVSSQVISYAQSWNELEDRIANTGATAYQTKEILDQLLETSNRNGRSIEESSELYIRLSNSMKEMGYSTNQTLNYIDTLSNLLTINKTSSMAAESAMNALTRAQIKGKISGLEAQSVFNAMPSILQTLAKEFSKTGKKVTEIDVREMALKGQISMRQFSAAIIAAQEDTAALADNMRNNVNDGITRITNNLKKLAGELNNSTGATGLLVDTLIAISNHTNILATAIGVVAAAYAGKYISSIVAATKASASKSLADIQQAVTTNKLAKEELARLTIAGQALTAERNALIASKAATASKVERAAIERRLNEISKERAVLVTQETAAQAKLTLGTKISTMAVSGLKNAMNLLGGPAGILLIAAGAMYAWSQSNEEAKQKALDLGDYIDDLRNKYAKLNEAQKELENRKLQVTIDETTKAINLQRLAVWKSEKDYASYQRRTEGYISKRLTSQDELNRLALQASEDKEKLLMMESYHNELLKTQGDIKNNNLTTDTSNTNKVKTEENSLYNEQVNILTGLLTKKKELTELEKINAEIATGTLKDLEPAQQSELQRLASQVDLMRAREQIEKERLQREKERQQLTDAGNNFSNQQLYENKSELDKIEADETAKIEKLNYYNDLKIYTEQTYQNALTSIKETAAKKRKKIQDDEKAAALKNTQDLLSASSSLFDGLAGIYKAYEGEQSESYKAMFAVSKGFQMASATLALYSAAMTAFDDKATTSPAGKVANYAAVIAAGGGLLAQIASISYGGGRLNGGSVTAGTMYRVGENNKPEILQSGGKQYMIAGENGRVFSNNEVTSNGSQSLNWTFIVENNASGVEVSQPDINRDKMIVRLAVNEVASGIRNKTGAVHQALSQTTNLKSRL